MRCLSSYKNITRVDNFTIDEADVPRQFDIALAPVFHLTDEVLVGPHRPHH